MSAITKQNILGFWEGDHATIHAGNSAIHTAIRDLNHPVFIMHDQQNQYSVSSQGRAVIGVEPSPNHMPLAGFVPANSPRQLGDISFCEDHGLNFPYMCGAMANGIASVKLVEAAANAGFLGSFGAAGLSLVEIEKAIKYLSDSLPTKPFCCNLIFTPNEINYEDAVVSLYLRYNIRLIEASAYMGLTLPVVRYRVHGIHCSPSGEIETPNKIIAKASRIEIASKWLSPPPEKILTQLLASNEITEQQATLATQIPMAQDITVEADSGGHTDNRPSLTLLPTIINLRNRLQQQFNYNTPPRVGAAGGISTPVSAAATFSMGAAYIVTGTVNQACIESGSSDIARKMLAEAEQTDVTMAPAVDMFEMGVKLQVLKRGTMFAFRANKLYELYNAYETIEEIPEKHKKILEQSIFQLSLSEVWKLTKDFFNERDPQQIAKAESNGKHKMALIFRWYLGLSSRWANAGDITRQLDYQIWCGPAMGAFNDWTKNTWLAKPATRNLVTIALNIIYGAIVIMRFNHLKNQGIQFSYDILHLTPLKVQEIQSKMI
ncbi:Enoyl-[acyl-carrier-protein] reductase [FMN], inferred for PFA pathway [uncultured Candidatus Thioglobus sp.]|nr:Enoyl-[acyl-carrier-protein] reductase [FMN], inferred for PFA pathway [uncultured Candidatus Thioglobus sp.]